MNAIGKAAHADVRPKHKLALNRLTKFMHTYTNSAVEAAMHRNLMPYDNINVTYRDRPPAMRKPSAAMRTLLDALCTPKAAARFCGGVSYATP